MNNFAKDGLRTLVFGKRKMSDIEVKDILKKYNKICSTGDKDKDKYLTKLFEDIEKGLNYIGFTGIEDKLQDVIFFNQKINCIQIKSI